MRRRRRDERDEREPASIELRKRGVRLLERQVGDDQPARAGLLEREREAIETAAEDELA